ncbi:S8 family serine peptidase [Tautonia sp. JC769]|uniref:S8 family serine peptidase n=1 Tax=Tautonia sp. JC769 TaxID=3232135 RepID=UPI0034584442
MSSRPPRRPELLGSLRTLAIVMILCLVPTTPAPGQERGGLSSETPPQWFMRYIGLPEDARMRVERLGLVVIDDVEVGPNMDVRYLICRERTEADPVTSGSALGRDVRDAADDAAPAPSTRAVRRDEGRTRALNEALAGKRFPSEPSFRELVSEARRGWNLQPPPFEAEDSPRFEDAKPLVEEAPGGLDITARMIQGLRSVLGQPILRVQNALDAVQDRVNQDLLILDATRDPRIVSQSARALRASSPVNGSTKLALADAYRFGWNLEQIGSLEVPRGPFGGAPLHPIIVAVIDTGVDLDHPEICDYLWENLRRPNPASNNPVDSIDDKHGAHFIESGAGQKVSITGDPDDDNGHGSHVAGTIVQIAGKSKHRPLVKIMALKVLDENGEGRLSQATRAMEYALHNGALILNNSWEIAETLEEDELTALVNVIEQCEQQGALVVAAAGNGDLDLDRDPVYPASVDNPCVLSVMSVDPCGVRTNQSNYGRFSVDIAAPGGRGTLPYDAEHDIVSTTYDPFGDKALQYDIRSGTSFAAAHATGVFALAWLRHDGARAQDIIRLVKAHARRVDNLEPLNMSGGIVDLSFLISDSREPTPLSRECQLLAGQICPRCGNSVEDTVLCPTPPTYLPAHPLQPPLYPEFKGRDVPSGDVLLIP